MISLNAAWVHPCILSSPFMSVPSLQPKEGSKFNQKMSRFSYLLILALLGAVQSVICGETAAESKEQIILFFRESRLKCDDPNSELVDWYNQDIYRKMDQVENESNRDAKDILIGEINEMIYLKQLEDLKPEVETVLQALDHMLPSCIQSKPIRESIGKLKSFYEKDQTLGAELLLRIKARAVDKKLTTVDLVKTLYKLRDQWIPLGLLTKVLDST